VTSRVVGNGLGDPHGAIRVGAGTKVAPLVCLANFANPLATLNPVHWESPSWVVGMGSSRGSTPLLRSIYTGGQGRRSVDGLPCLVQPGHRSEEHTSELQSRENLVCRLLL